MKPDSLLDDGTSSRPSAAASALALSAFAAGSPPCDSHERTNCPPQPPPRASPPGLASSRALALLGVLAAPISSAQIGGSGVFPALGTYSMGSPSQGTGALGTWPSAAARRHEVSSSAFSHVGSGSWCSKGTAPSVFRSPPSASEAKAHRPAATTSEAPT